MGWEEKVEEKGRRQVYDDIFCSAKEYPIDLAVWLKDKQGSLLQLALSELSMVAELLEKLLFINLPSGRLRQRHSQFLAP